jgi:hypothetical protein
VKPRRIDAATRVSLAWMSRCCDWRSCLVIVRPETVIRWHRTGWRVVRRKAVRWERRSDGGLAVPLNRYQSGTAEPRSRHGPHVRRHRYERVLVMQTAQHRVGKHERTRCQSMSGLGFRDSRGFWRRAGHARAAMPMVNRSTGRTWSSGTACDITTIRGSSVRKLMSCPMNSSACTSHLGTSWMPRSRTCMRPRRLRRFDLG